MHTGQVTGLYRNKVPLSQECLHIMGDPERCAPGGHMCCGLMGITEHILQILQRFFLLHYCHYSTVYFSIVNYIAMRTWHKNFLRDQ